MLKPVKLTIFRPTLCKTGVHTNHAQNKKQFSFFKNKKKQILSFQNLFILIKYHMFWLSYQCFSILCNGFLLKSAISSHNSCALPVSFIKLRKWPALNLIGTLRFSYTNHALNCFPSSLRSSVQSYDESLFSSNFGNFGHFPRFLSMLLRILCWTGKICLEMEL